MRTYIMSVWIVGMFFLAGGFVQAQSFTDVPTTHTSYTEVEEMKDLAIITGYEDQTFRPGQAILRKHVAALIYKSMPLEVVRPATVFADVAKGSSYYEMIQALYQAGIIDGTVIDGKRYYKPEESLTRAQMAKIIVLAYDLSLKETASFNDVEPSDWSYDYIQCLYSNHITTGNNGLFMPSKQVTRQHFAVFMYRTLGEKKQLSRAGQAHYTLHQLVRDGKAYAPGRYTPTQIPTGEYILMPETDGLSYYGEELANGEVLVNEIFDTFGYVYVQGFGHVTTDGVLLSLTDLTSAGYRSARDLYAALQDIEVYQGAGMYKIGVDLPAATYTLTASDSSAYMSLNSGAVGKGMLIHNAIFAGTYLVSVEQAQYLLVSGAIVQ